MPNRHVLKEYGAHKYAEHGGTSDCVHGCGCWMGPARSGGSAGIDPFGTCPGNPLNGESLGGAADYANVVNGRILDLTTRLASAEEQLKQVAPDKSQLAETVRILREKLAEKKRHIAAIRHIVGNEE